jgi:hypothetical protein
VRPGIAKQAAAFKSRGIELELLRAGDEVFNEIAFRSPDGQRVAVLEARTFSPVTRQASDTSLCGYFTELSIPTTDFEAARRFWEPLGFVATEESATPYLHLSLTSDHLNLAFHRPRTFDDCLLVFSDPDMATRIARLRSMNLKLSADLPKGLSSATNALLCAPEGTALLLLQDQDVF